MTEYVTVVLIRKGVVDTVSLYVGEQNKISKQAEERYKKLAVQYIGLTEEEAEESLDDGYCQSMDTSVCITWPEIYEIRGSSKGKVMVHLFPNGNVEVPYCRPRGLPTYRWTPAYSSITSVTGESIPLTRRHWQQIANRDALKLKFWATKAKALAAYTEEL